MLLRCLSVIQGLRGKKKKKKKKRRGSRSEAGAEAFPSSDHKGCLRLPPSDSADEGPALLQGPLHSICWMSLLDPGTSHAASSKSPRAPKATRVTDCGPWSCSHPHPLQSQPLDESGLRTHQEQAQATTNGLLVSLETLTHQDAQLECHHPVRATNTALQPSGTRQPRDTSASRSLPQLPKGTQLCLQLPWSELMGA